MSPEFYLGGAGTCAPVHYHTHAINIMPYAIFKKGAHVFSGGSFSRSKFVRLATVLRAHKGV